MTPADPMHCEECGKPHVTHLGKPSCTGHRKSVRPKEPCTNPPRKGQKVCRMHGGSSGQAKRAAARRLVTNQARRFLSQEELVPIADPVSDLLALTAESRAMYVHLRDLVAQTETQRWSVPIGKDGRAALDVLVAAMERAMERTGKLLEVVVRLNLEERLVAISEAQAELIRRVIFGTLADPELALSVEVQAKAPAVVTRHLRAVKAG